MKKYFFIATILSLSLFSFKIHSQKFSKLDKSPMDVTSFPSIHDFPNATILKAVYSRPQLKGREINNLIPNGELWRTGANEATVIILYKDMRLGEKLIKAGSYSLATIPGDKEWVIIINSDVNVWGAYKYKQNNDVVRLKVPVTRSNEIVEAFSIAMEKSDEGINMILGWDKLRVEIPFKD